jgi:ankyrin repeat protein
VSNNKLSTVKVLLTFNPAIDKVTRNFETPLLIAVKNQNLEIAETLIRAGADIDFPDKHGAAPLHYASLNGYLDIVDLLLYYDASIDEKSDTGTTPLLASIWAGNQDVSDLLIQNGADPNGKDNDGYSPFLMAAYYGDTIVMKILALKGADIYARNKAGHNALILTILSGQTAANKLLFKLGDKWSSNENTALNPYKVAVNYRRKDIISTLEKNNISERIIHKIDQLTISLSSRFSMHDFYPGINLAFKEPWFNGGLIVGCDVKLWYSRVLIKNSDQLFYQYMDKGSVAYAGLFKDFSLTDKPDRFNFSFSTSLLAGYSFGNKLKGTMIDPANNFHIIPSVSFKVSKMNLSMNLGLEYLKTRFYKDGPLWFRIGISYSQFINKVKDQVKPIKWY